MMASRFRRRIAWVSLCVGVAMVRPASIGADTLSKVLNVSATVVTGCANLTVNPLSFGSYPSGSATPLDATAEVSITCDAATWTIDAGPGLNFEAVAGMVFRRMWNGVAGQYLRYDIFTDAARTTHFGTGIPGGTSLPGAGSTTLTLYGRVPASQAPGSGSYTDQVDVTLTF